MIPEKNIGKMLCFQPKVTVVNVIGINVLNIADVFVVIAVIIITV